MELTATLNGKNSTRGFIRNLPERLGRITSGGKLIREIDGLRFVAIMPVLIQHLSERFDRNVTVAFSANPDNSLLHYLSSRGFIGVYIFFVISGFVLALPFASYKLNQTKEVKLSSYYLRRLTRLEPTYIIWMTLLFLSFIIIGHRSFIAYLPHYLANITYTHAPIYGTWSPFNPPTWTLEIEVQFYILAPFLALAFFSIKNKVIRRIVIASFIVILMMVQQKYRLFTGYFGYSVLGHLHYFLIGFILTDIYITEWNTNTARKNVAFDAVAILSLILLIVGWDWNFDFYRRIFVVLMLFGFFYSAFKSIYVNRLLTNKWIMAIGGMCYTIYLIHLPVAEFAMRFTKHITFTNDYAVNLLIQLAIFLPVVLSMGAVFFLLFEKPFMNKDWPKNLSSALRRWAGPKNKNAGNGI